MAKPKKLIIKLLKLIIIISYYVLAHKMSDTFNLSAFDNALKNALKNASGPVFATLSIYCDEGKIIHANIKARVNVNDRAISRTDSCGSYLHSGPRHIFDILCSSAMVSKQQVLLEGRDEKLYLDDEEIDVWDESDFSIILVNQAFEKIRISDSIFHSR